MPAPLLVFDLDGTLADTAPDLIAALAAVLPRYGFPYIADPNMRHGIGHGARSLIEYALRQQGASVDSSTLDAMHRDFLTYHEAHICESTHVFPGAEALLDRFEAAGWRSAVCTNKIEALSRLLLDKLGITRRFVAICGGDTFPTRKPDPAHLEKTIAAAGGTRDAAIMIGDSRTDLDTARAARVPMIGVTFGYTLVPMRELGPDFLVDAFDQVTVEIARDLLRSVGSRAKGPQPAPALP